MPAHGIRLDLEFVGLAVSAALLSVFMTGEVISNVLFVSLISVLFFLIGNHLDTEKLKKFTHYRKEVGIGILMVYILTPLAAFGMSYLVSEGLGNAFVAIGVSAAAIGSPVVFSNRGRGEGDLALIIGGLSLVAGLLIIPLLLFGLNVGFPSTEFAVKNLLFVGIPLLLGVGAQRYSNALFDDLRHHFSKLALWLIILVTAVQFQMVYQVWGVGFATELGTAIVLMTGFVFFSFIASYYISRLTGIMERNARTVGFVAGSKSIAVALLVASQFGGEAVAYVSAYYFVRQIVTGTISEYFHSGEIRLFSRLKANLPGTR